jgi:8-oxo-dGTP diphosphatase
MALFGDFMKKEMPRVGLGVLILNHKNEILLGKRKGTHGATMWAPPGGHLEFGESFEECAIREVFEETGLNVSNPKFLAVTNDFFAVEEKHYISVFMTVIFPDNQTINNKEPEKVDEWLWFKPNQLPIDLFMPLLQLVSNKGYGNDISRCPLLS